MRPGFKQLYAAAHWKHFLFLAALCFSVFSFLISLDAASGRLSGILSSSLFAGVAGLLGCLFLFLVWLVIAWLLKGADAEKALNDGLLTLSPTALLLISGANAAVTILLPVVLVLGAQMILFWILSKQKRELKLSKPYFIQWLVIITVVYAALIFLRVKEQFQHAALFNPRDFAIYNQIFWNTVHGKLFLSSDYGGYFTNHNIVFFFLLVPFYTLLQHPLTLSGIQLLLFVFSLVPLYLIMKKRFNPLTMFVLSLTFLFYPAFMAQHFTPPHEIGYVPFFLLFTYYFYREQRFAPFLVFLLLCLSIKEHVAFTAFCFGLLALLQKRKMKWTLLPVLLGCAWVLLSFKIMAYAKTLYPDYALQTWLIDDLKMRFFVEGRLTFESIMSGLSASNLGQIYSVKLLLLFLLPLGLLPPFLSTVSLLGVPEILLGLISDRQALLYPARHYGLIFSCFLFLGMLEGLERISKWQVLEMLQVRRTSLQLLCAVLVLTATLMLAPLWGGMAGYTPQKESVQTAIAGALAAIPAEASVSVPTRFAPVISGRKDYALLGDGRYLDYVLIDPDKKAEQGVLAAKGYRAIFSAKGYKVYVKTSAALLAK